MAELNNTIVKGNLRVTSQAEAQEFVENGTSLTNKYAAKSHTHSAVNITISDVGSYTNVKQAIGDLNSRTTAVETALDGLLVRLTAI